ncbi:MAG: His/Gly/Thr/Pro-type tRNA ligase C-terminal domain-containing protein [Acidimicrobiales bacterium]
MRRAGVRADRSFDGRSMRAQMKAADRSGARVALIVGDQERLDGTVSIRSLEAEVRSQVAVARADVVTHVQELLS